MLTSLLSFYIAQNLEAGVAPQEISTTDSEEQGIVRVANSNVSRVVESLPIPTKNPGYISPIIDAKGVISIDRKTGKILYEKKAYTRLPMASITILITILVILEEHDDLSETTIVSSNAANIEGSQMYLITGEKISIEKLIKGTLIHSANDAAIALAEHNAGSVDKFVEKMNKRALELGLINTQYANPTGLDHPENFSSPYDIARLANFVYHNPLVEKNAQIKELTVTSENGKLIHKLENTNDLLDSFLHIKGLKTGRTDAAGLCLVSVAEHQENDIITVVLNSPDRFRETKILVDWSYRAFTWR